MGFLADFITTQTAGAAGSLLGGLSSFHESSQAADFMGARGKNAMREAENNAWMHREKAKQQASSQRAAFGASGVDVNVGTPVHALADTEATGEVAAVDALYQGKKEKHQWNMQKNAAHKQAGKAMFGTLTSVLEPGGKGPFTTFHNNFQQGGKLGRG